MPRRHPVAGNLGEPAVYHHGIVERGLVGGLQAVQAGENGERWLRHLGQIEDRFVQSRFDRAAFILRTNLARLTISTRRFPP